MVWQVLGTATLVACVWLVIASTILSGLRAAEGDYDREIGSLAAIMAEQTANALTAADYLIGFVAEDFAEPQPDDRLARRVASGALRLDNLVLLSVVDTGGRLLQTNNGPSSPRIDLSDREHIRVHLDGQSRPSELFVGKPVRGRASGQWSIQLTRAIRRKDASVAGVVVGSLDPRYFEKVWQVSMLPRRMRVELVGSDGYVRALTDDLAEAFEAQLQRSDIVARIGRARSGRLQVPGDGLAPGRVVHFRQVGDLPLYMTLSAPADEPRRSFGGMQRQYLTLGALTTLTIVLLASVLVRRTRQLIAERQEALVARQRLHDAVEAIPEGFALFDGEDRLVVFNDAYKRVYDMSVDLVRPGITFEALIREGAKRGQYPAAAGRIEEWVSERLEMHRDPPGPFEQQIGDGRWLRIEERRMAGGGIVGIRADISAIKQREMELARQTAMLSTTFEHMSEGLSIVADSGILIAHNRRFETLLDLPANLAGENLPLRDLLAIYADGSDTCSASGAAQTIYQRSIAKPGTTVVWQREDGREIAFRSSRLPDGRTVTMYSDVTEVNRAARKIRFSEAQKSAMISSSLDAVVVIDELGLVQEFNESAERIFGWPAKEIIGLSAAETIVPPEDLVAHSDALARYRETHDSAVLGRRVEVTALRRDGRRFPAELTVAAIRVDGRDLFSAYIRDISDRKRLDLERREALEAAQSASRAKSEFLAMVSHEVRTPLNGIVGFAGLLRTTSLTPEQMKFTLGVEDASNRLLCLINEILEFSRIEAGRLAIDVGPYRPVALIESAVEMTQALMHGKPVRIETVIADAVPDVLVGDQARVMQILQNLLANSAKFTEAGRIRIAVDAVPLQAGHVTIVIDISDTGIGIPPERRATLFQAFEQGGTEVARRFGGSGLGLAICRRLAALMEGKVELVDSSSAGSTFRVVILQGVGQAGSLPVDRPTTTTPARDARPLQILVAEDTPANQIVARAMLEKSGHWVQVVGNGAEAVQALKERRFDVVLMDMQMPVLDGGAAAQQIRGMAGPVASTPIIAVSAQARDSDIAEAKRNGIAHYLVKPITLAALQATLAAAVTGLDTPPAGEGSAEREASAAIAGASSAEVDAGDVDREMLHAIQCDIGEEMFQHLLATFMRDAAGGLRSLGEALQSADAAAMRGAAHKLAGLLGQFGLRGAARVAQQIEQAAEPLGCGADVKRLTVTCDEAIGRLRCAGL